MKRTTDFDISAMENVGGYTIYLLRLLDLAISRFKWTGLPDTVDERFLELTLITEGKALYFNDDIIGNLCMEFTVAGPLDIYRVPTKRRAYAVNGYQKECDEKNSVIIWNNRLRANIYPVLVEYAKRLYELDRVIDVNVRSQKTPILLMADEKQRLTLMNVYKNYDGNAPVIFGDKNLDLSGLTAIHTDAPYVADRIYELKTKLWNEALTYLGISNVSTVKKERMITDEVTRQLGGTLASRFSGLAERETACERINKMFGTDISVEFKDVEEELPEDEQGGSKQFPQYSLTEKAGGEG